ncbi:hypothetical protein GZ977_000095 [Clostridium perfringens]
MFLSRSIFIKVLGANISGLNSLFTSLIGFLNVAELGIGMAVGYSLYKPLSEGNYKKINEIMILFKEYYKKIAIIIFFSGCVLSIFLPLLIKNQVNLKNAYIYYYLYIINCVLSYLFTYKQTLIIADQKEYKITILINSIKFLKIIIQIIFLFLKKSFFIWILCEIIFNLISMILVNKRIDFEYKNKINYKSEKTVKQIKKENLEIKKNIKNIFFHKIGGFVVFQTDAILISVFSTLKETAIYANYTMVINALIGLISTAIGSVMPSIGNLIAEEKNEKIYLTFKNLYFIDHILAIFICTVTYKLIDNFIIIWVGKEYLFSKKIVMVIIVNLYIQISRGSVDRFKNGFGIYWDVGAPLIEAIINLIFSIALACKFGIIGVFIGTIISNIIIVEIWKPYILFKEGFNISIRKYIKLTSEIIVKNLVIIIIFNFILDNFPLSINFTKDIIGLIIYAIIASVIAILCILGTYSFSKEFRNLLKYYIKKINFKIDK